MEKKHGGGGKTHIQKDGKSKVSFQKIEQLVLKWRKKITISSKIKIKQCSKGIKKL